MYTITNNQLIKPKEDSITEELLTEIRNKHIARLELKLVTELFQPEHPTGENNQQWLTSMNLPFQTIK